MSSSYLPLQLNSVGLVLNDSQCLDNINLDIDSSGITVIMGENGSGKTLLLKLFAGLLKPSHGSVVWHQQPKPPALTLVPQQAVLFNTSVENNILHPLRYHHVEDAERHCSNALEWAGIAHLKANITMSLSTGEQQLVALARAWSLNPKVLLLDEPSANFDPTRRQQIDKLIKELSYHCKIIMTTHSIHQARELATEIILLSHGKLLSHSTSDDFFTSTEFNQFAGIQ
jgi:tungstate transport system ATP-binding protein